MVQPRRPATNDMFQMNLSGKRLTSRKLLEALLRLVTVLEEEEAIRPSKSCLARPLELILARNDLTTLTFPTPEDAPRMRTTPKPQKQQREDEPMMMMLMGWKKDEPKGPEVSDEEEAVQSRPRLEDRLVCLDVSYNKLGPDLLVALGDANLWRLRRLDLAGNHLRSVRGLGRLGALEDLGLSRNDLRDIEGLAPLKALRKLDCSDNELTLASLRPLSLNQGLTDLNVTGVKDAPADARRAFRAAFPRLRRLTGLAAVEEEKDTLLFAPHDRMHDSYVDVHLRRRAQTTGKVPIPLQQQKKKKKQQQRPTPIDFDPKASIHPRPTNDADQDPARSTRDMLETRYARPTFRGFEADTPPGRMTPSRNDDIPVPVQRRRQSRNDDGMVYDVPWRQPPNPVPRWMIERSVGKQAAQTIIRRCRTPPPESRKKGPRKPSSDIDRTPGPPSTVGTDDLAPSQQMPASVLDALEQIVRYQRDNFAHRRITFSSPDDSASSSY